MSFDILFHCWRDGEPFYFDAAILDDVFRGCVTRRDPGHMLVSAPGSGSTVEVYLDEGDAIHAMMLTSAGAEPVMDLFVALCARTNSSLAWGGVGLEVAVTGEDVLPHLPPEMRDDAGRVHVVRTGGELLAAILR